MTVKRNYLCLHRTAADFKGGPEHCSKSSTSALQSTRGGCLAVTFCTISPGPQEAEEQPFFKRSSPSRFANEARPAAQPRAETRHFRR